LPNCSGLDARLMVEVALVSHRSKMTFSEAIQWMLSLLPSYERAFSLEGGNPCPPFDQVYDLSAIQPTNFWEKMYEQVKAKLQGMGLSLKFAVFFPLKR
jgi:hypothetical protein